MLPHPLNWDLRSDWTFRMGMFQTIRLVALHDYQIMHYHYSSWLLKHCSNLYHVKSIAHNWKELIKKNNASLPMWTHDSWILPFDIFSLLHMVLTTTSPNRQKNVLCNVSKWKPSPHQVWKHWKKIYPLSCANNKLSSRRIQIFSQQNAASLAPIQIWTHRKEIYPFLFEWQNSSW